MAAAQIDPAAVVCRDATLAGDVRVGTLRLLPQPLWAETEG